MDYQEAIEVLTCEYGCVDLDTANRRCIEKSEQKFMDACKAAISAMQELQIYKENEKRNLSRTDRLMDECVYRHENGNCLKVGGFCTSVPLSHCQRYKDWHMEYRRYKQIGTMEELQEIKRFYDNIYPSVEKELKELIEYRKLGTLEEVLEAVEKQHPKKPTYKHYEDIGEPAYIKIACPNGC